MTQRSLTRTQAKPAFSPVQTGLLQRTCTACGQHTIAGGECVECNNNKQVLQRRAANQSEVEEVPAIVHDVLRAPGHRLDANTQNFMESRFEHDFSQVRVHTDTKAAESARAVNALAYTVGRNVVFGSGQYAPETNPGKHLIAHELTHVLQQGLSYQSHIGISDTGNSSPHERNADANANAVLSGRSPEPITSSGSTIQRRSAPYIKKITVHLTPPQSADLEWEGTPPADATGSDHFTVSTGKGYSNPEDPAGTCTRTCCGDAMTQCAPPWNRPDRVGSCCTYYGNNFWTGTSVPEHNGWQWWTPIQPYYSSRGIALHQHTEVTDQPIGHGCVRMDELNAKRIYDYSNGRKTNVTIDGRAAPVACDASRQCNASSNSGSNSGSGALEEETRDTQLALEEQEAVAGLEGVMS